MNPSPGGSTSVAGSTWLLTFAWRVSWVLKVIVRPGPYICAEWEFGGLPAWLLKDPGMRVRCLYPPYIQAVDRFFDQLLPQLVPLQTSQGGPLIAIQVENEYGSFGNDQAYLCHLEEGLRARGYDGFLFTSDGPSDEMLQYGTLPHVFKTANFGSGAAEGFAKLREYQPGGPLMCAEFWNGWFDHWGEPHHIRPAADAAQTLDEILAAGASVSVYMFHGGTNFGFMSGANASPGPRYQATVTSYDYDAPLDEAGNPTPKYAAFRDVIARHIGQTPALSRFPDPREPLARWRCLKIGAPVPAARTAFQPRRIGKSLDHGGSRSELRPHPLPHPGQRPARRGETSLR